ncbi:glycosyltransferase [Microbacterium jiangjiandongii]|uniref:glycosyltransferase n=1 Tax=Microbacterium jiangjiandongii TaxID=3049071 RepID=UPI0035A987BE
MLFVTITSQRDNLGDSLLRRPLIRAAQTGGACHVFVGRGASDWTNLGLRTIDTLYTSRRRWLGALFRSALSQRTSLFLNAGELLPDLRFRVTRALMAPAIGLVKLRGGAVIHAGFGLRDPGGKVPFAAKATIRASDLVSWRDEASRHAVGIGTVCPDWAMGEGPPVEVVAERQYEVRTSRVLALSIRGDRPIPSDEWVETVRRTAANDLQARIVVVCQVRRDAVRAEWLARQLDAQLIAWPDSATHADQERAVRAAYSKATWVASDRLHSVVMAVTEGAIPLDLVPDSSRKVSRALAVADLTLLPARHASARIDADQAQVLNSLRSARSRLDDLACAIAARVSGERATPLRVLHTVSAPDHTTRYARHMAATEDFGIRPLFLGWPRALFGRYEALHVHWPEHFVPAGSSPRERAVRLLARIVIRRVRRRRIPVIRTLHNVTPHRPVTRDWGATLRSALDMLTTAEIHLVPGDPKVSEGTVHLIPHGSYREPYADVPTQSAVPGRALHFGRLEQYKGVPELLGAMHASRIEELRIVGAPTDQRVAQAVRDAAASDNRISYQFGFVPDEDLAVEISRSSLCVFPYRELHSSGAVLVALSLNRPILVPLTATTVALQQEVGDEWVRIYRQFDSSELDAALEWSLHARKTSRPNLDERSWQRIRDQHGNVLRSAVAERTAL